MMTLAQAVSRLLATWRTETPAPTSSGLRTETPAPTSSGLVLVRFRRRYSSSTGLLNRGEVAGFPEPLAASLVARKIARRVEPGAVSRVRPRPEPVTPRPRGHDPEIATACRREGVWFPGPPLLDDDDGPALPFVTLPRNGG